MLKYMEALERAHRTQKLLLPLLRNVACVAWREHNKFHRIKLHRHFLTCGPNKFLSILSCVCVGRRALASVTASDLPCIFVCMNFKTKLGKSFAWWHVKATRRHRRRWWRHHQNRYLYTAVFPVLFVVRATECDFNSSRETISPFVSKCQRKLFRLWFWIRNVVSSFIRIVAPAPPTWKSNTFTKHTTRLHCTASIGGPFSPINYFEIL